jgi:tetratricopeptide (TPR) repeat protein
MLRVSDPDALIAERLSGQVPFTARDPFSQTPDDPPPAVPGGDAVDVDDGGAIAVPVEEIPASQAPAPEPAAAPAPPLPRAESRDFDEMDITGALGDLDAPVAAKAKDLEQVFRERREEAVDAQPDYSAQHMTLARTYLEMGMLDEAVAALTTAVRSPAHRFEAAAALGRVHLQRGEPAQAVEWLERAAETPAPDPAAAHALLYDLGVLLEEAGEVHRALAVFLELQSEAGDYRDVPSRIDRLARAQSGG